MLAVAAGAILAMVTHTMIPGVQRASKVGGEKQASPARRALRVYDKIEAMAVVGGFLVAFILSRSPASRRLEAGRDRGGHFGD